MIHWDSCVVLHWLFPEADDVAEECRRYLDDDAVKVSDIVVGEVIRELQKDCLAEHANAKWSENDLARAAAHFHDALRQRKLDIHVTVPDYERLRPIVDEIRDFEHILEPTDVHILAAACLDQSCSRFITTDEVLLGSVVTCRKVYERYEVTVEGFGTEHVKEERLARIGGARKR